MKNKKTKIPRNSAALAASMRKSTKMKHKLDRRTKEKKDYLDEDSLETESEILETSGSFDQIF